MGDIGDNQSQRSSIRVVRVPEPDLNTAGGAASTRTIPAEDVRVFTLQYPDTAHDAEALLVDPVTGDLFVVTKERRRARLYHASLDELQESDPVRLQLTGYYTLSEGEHPQVNFFRMP